MNYPNYYQPMNQYQPMAQPSQGILWCQGEEGARGYMVAAGSTVLLMDSEKQSFYIKSTDQSGMPQPLRIFDYTERPQNGSNSAFKPSDGQVITREEINGILARLDALEGGIKDEPTI